MKTTRMPVPWNNWFLIVLSVLLLPIFPYAPGVGAASFGPDTSDMGEGARRGEELFRSTCQACHSLKYSGYEAKMPAAIAKTAFGKVPSDLNLIVKAKGGEGKGTAFVSRLLTGYEDTPAKNSVVPNIAMPPPFSKDDPELGRKANDVAAFLDYVSDPSEGKRQRLGEYVMGYMMVLTALLFAANRRTWKGIRKSKT